MKEREELKQELQWVQYRQKMLDIMEEKLLQMREMAEQAKRDNLTEVEIEALNDRLNNLAIEVRVIDSESRKTEDRRML